MSLPCDSYSLFPSNMTVLAPRMFLQSPLLHGVDRKWFVSLVKSYFKMSPGSTDAINNHFDQLKTRLLLLKAVSGMILF